MIKLITRAVFDIVPSRPDSGLSGEGICGASGISATWGSSGAGFGDSGLIFWLAADGGLAWDSSI